MVVAETVAIDSLHNISVVQDGNMSSPSILFLGGWDQNFELMQKFQQTLAESEGVNSVGLSAFDLIDPLDIEPIENFEGFDLNSFNAEQLSWIKELPPRMVKRAVILNDLSQTILSEAMDTKAVVTHCGGANVLLIANLLAAWSGQKPLMPATGLLAEAMLAEGIRPLKMAKAYAESEARAKNDPKRYISLQSLRIAGSQQLGMQAKLPLEDLLNSTGIQLFAEATSYGMDYELLLGQQDHATPLDIIHEQLEAYGLSGKIQLYPNQPRFGHGYLFAEPKSAAAYIGQYILGLSQ